MMYSVAELVVDATDDDDFQMKFDALIVSWRNHSVSSSADLEGFIEWFTKKNKRSVICDTSITVQPVFLFVRPSRHTSLTIQGGGWVTIPLIDPSASVSAYVTVSFPNGSNSTSAFLPLLYCWKYQLLIWL